MKCENCNHAEMCRWIDELEGRGCDFYDNQGPCEILENIKAEIEREADYQYAYVDADIAKGMYLALEIIDKHISGKE